MTDDRSLSTDAPPRAPGPAVLPLAVALLVIVSTWALVPIAVWLILALPLRVLGIVAGLLVLGIVWEVRPRRERLPIDAARVPATVRAVQDLAAECARAVGAAAPDTIAVLPGMSFRRALLSGDGVTVELGAPAWLALSPPARGAAGAPARAPSAAGGPSSSRVVGAALATLVRWRALLDGPLGDRPSTRAMGSSAFIANISAPIARAAIWVVGLVPLLLSMLLERLIRGPSARAVLHADQLAARAAGAEAMRELLTLSTRLRGLDAALQRASHANRSTLDEARQFTVEPLTASASAAAPQNRSAADTRLAERIAALSTAPTSVLVVLDAGRAAAVEAELAPAYTKVEPAVRDRYR